MKNKIFRRTFCNTSIKYFFSIPLVSIFLCISLEFELESRTHININTQHIIIQLEKLGQKYVQILTVYYHVSKLYFLKILGSTDRCVREIFEFCLYLVLISVYLRWRFWMIWFSKPIFVQVSPTVIIITKWFIFWLSDIREIWICSRVMHSNSPNSEGNL